ncbi:unknown [Betafusellovirus yellowstonense]|uniref:Uncharacterized protein n=1 Tax=Betafusellovirus yellowstonense TaxID=693629 RepID=D1GFA9_9VIRU|nr:hypothetical protein SSSV1_gp25 [Acidianus spindle-shaped virus 1]ACZ35810.1 unknown [Acidianus spindle-shaped virus 1]
MKKELLVLGILSVFLIPMLMPLSNAYEIYNPPSPGGPTFYPILIENDAGYAYNLTRITFVSTLVNLTGTFKYNSSEGGTQYVDYYIALGQIVPNEQYGAYYIQPVIIFAADGNVWILDWQVQAWGNNSGNPYKEYSTYDTITDGSGSSANLNCLFNLTIKATLNSQGQITSAWVYIANAKTGQVYFSQTINLQYLIPDKQVFFEVEDPLSGNAPANFPVIPSSNYIFVNALASNSTAIFNGLPLYNGVGFVMGPPKATACAIPTFGTGTQGVLYYG